ncbi:AbiV family abortive infection protein [Arenibacter sp. TNZ]|uniref:AbiV family abortive infection protein n=1 Tax=Arenibacter TaxID=178469 RepID=UPI000CD45979|nr:MULTISPECIES: AbiV family abortive infection protein [Arenibacter]MCM4171869.1 AbiV family abortive infection protein [Arenibacter sp. TNZ]
MIRENYFDGILKSLSNATDLFDDAEILFKLKRYPRAYALYQYTIEEVGKAFLIYNFVLSKNHNNEHEQKEFKKEFRDHKTKTQNAIGLDIMLAFAVPEKKTKSAIMYQVAEHEKKIKKINDLKNSSFYTDLRNNKFILPQEIIDEKITTEIQSVAQTRLNVAKSFLKMAMEHFDKLQLSANDIDFQKMIDSPPEEILELIKFKYGIDIKKK